MSEGWFTFGPGGFVCGHCHRDVKMVHAGSGPAICCQCVVVWRAWLRLDKIGVRKPYSWEQDDPTFGHPDGWCERPEWAEEDPTWRPTLALA